MADTGGEARGPGNLAILWRAAAAGAALWALSPLITGRREPWDAQVPYYWIGLVVIGIALARYAPRRSALPLILLGLYLGQVAWGLVAIGAGSLLPIGLLALAVYLVPAYVAARVTYWWAGRAAPTRQ